MGTDPGVGWAIAGARRAGPGKPSCQDAYRIALNGQAVVVALADGAGSARYGGIGANFTCEAAVARGLALLETYKNHAKIPNESLISVVTEIRDWLRLQAVQTGAELSELSCTLLLVLSDTEGMTLLQIGDGACVTASGGEMKVVRWPEQGEYANDTFFVTGSQAESQTHVERLDKPVDGFAIFSDGLQYLVLDSKTRLAHPPFFQRMFASLEGRSGESNDVSQWLEEMLGSPQVTSRTDDDTSIVVARRLPEALL